MPHRPELLRTWGILSTPPSNMDMTHEYNAMFEKQVLSRGMDDVSRFELFMRLSDFFFNFSREGYEETADCPPMQHSDLSWDELKENGIAVKDNKHDGDHIKLDGVASVGKKTRKKMLHVSGLDLQRSGHSAAPSSSGNQEEEEASHHPCYNYYRWLWVQFPWLRLGLYKEWVQQHMKRQAMLNQASAAPAPVSLDSPTSNRGAEDGVVAAPMPPPQKPKVVRKDPIVLRLERIKEERLHKAEEMQRMMEREEEERENQVTLEAQSAIKGEEEKKGKESPYRVKLRAKGNLGQKTKNKSGERTPNKKKNKWVIKFTPPGEKHGTGSTEDSVDRLHFAQPSHKPHVNGPNILDLDKKDKFSKKLTKMSGGTIAQRNELNKLLLTKRKKQRELQGG